MVSDSVQDVLDRARQVYLNDASALTYSNTTLLPYLKQAYDDLQGALERNNLQYKNAVADIKVPANSKSLSLPGNFYLPIELFERPFGSSTANVWVPISKKEFEPLRDPSNVIGEYAFRQGEIFFVGATSDVEVKLRYQEMFPSLKDGTSLIRGDALNYLAARVAALAHLFISGIETLARAANDIADESLDDIILTNVKKTQSLVARRRPYRPFTN